MIRQVYLLATLWLLLLLWLVARFPQALWWWLSLFIIGMTLLWLGHLLSRIIIWQRWLKRGHWAKLQQQCRVLWQARGGAHRPRHLAGLFLAMANVQQLQNTPDDGVALCAAQKQWQELELKYLPPRWHNAYWQAGAQLQLFANQPAAALQLLQKCQLQNLTTAQITTLFHLFSLLFYLTQQEPQRAWQYAAKAYEWGASQPLLQAHFGLAKHHLQNQADGLDLLRQALPQIPPGFYQRLYAEYLSRWPHQSR